MTDVPGGPQRIEQNIPLVYWHTVELQMDDEQRKAYAAIHQTCEKKMGKGYNVEQEVGLRSMRDHRRLCQGVFNPELDTFYRKVKSATEYLETWEATAEELPVLCYFALTRPADTMLKPSLNTRVTPYPAILSMQNETQEPTENISISYSTDGLRFFILSSVASWLPHHLQMTSSKQVSS